MEPRDITRILCPFCRARPIESTAKSVWVRGYLLAYHIASRTLIGCVPCVRTELYKEAGRSALLGWFSVTAATTNPLFIVYNLVRGLTVRPNPSAVLKRLGSGLID